MFHDNVILAIDQGTTSTRALAFDEQGQVRASAHVELAQIYPRDGWVEQDPDDIWRDTLTVWRQALEQSGAVQLAAIGLTNQRETTLVWDRRTGRAVYNAISWQDRRGAGRCQALAEEGYEGLIQVRTGLLLDSYFSATKVAWILENVEGARAAAQAGHLAFGTIDSFLLWRLTGGKVHATDATNASRTMLFNIHSQRWDSELLELFGVPLAMMPEVRDSACLFGHTDPVLYGRPVPIGGMAGDQQAALIGQACFRNGMVKSTYGTGCFVLANTGETPVSSTHRLITTIGYRIKGQPTYALEGSIFNAGSAVQWLRDRLGVIESARTTEYLASGLRSNHGVYFVPAFTGLGAPYWDPQARGALFGLTRDTGVAELARAALESVCYQTLDLIEAMGGDGVSRPRVVRADGGMARNEWMLKFLADILEVSVERPTQIETTAVGAAVLAALTVGLFPSLEAAAAWWRLDARFDPSMNPDYRARLCQGWHKAVGRTRESG
ncbi:glycerol kinase GlpK [Pararhodospirillum oryzae]|uniref:Glycerol kinase n=1 Tax=Pararhodospirillum oryzae TaxID=478448 RepID=A0A512H9E7_9PROT|nr:glycerol kinase GlpK [Pararhodospirillum oryzae]GEO82071.1 glycerol kinase [Pararhodospirillum oryzae]